MLLPKKQRMQLLADQITSLETQLQAAALIPVFRISRCGHADCGSPPPAQLPADALVIELGCSHQIPVVELPATEAGYRSRSEITPHLPATGSGLGAAGVRSTLSKLRVIPLR